MSRLRVLMVLCVVALGAFAAGCGSDDGDDTTTESSSDSAQLAAVKGYLTDHSAELAKQADRMEEIGEEYYDVAESVDFDYAKLLKQDCAKVDELLTEAKAVFVKANPAYEEMEGIVAGVPRLAHYDVDIDAGSDASDPESAVSFSLTLEDGTKLKQPGNLFFLMETALWGTNPDLVAKGVKADVDCDGKAEFGEGLPDAAIFKAATEEFADQTEQLDEDAQEFEPTPSDALTAIVVMTPTMSEYFGQWKNTAFVAGKGDQKEQSFVATSRLSDIADILEGIAFTYDEIEPQIAAESPAQAKQTKRELNELLAFAADLRDREADGEKFTPKQADQLGSEAQARAEAIAGQVTQSAQQLGIELQES
jgi:hypothetical protein